MTNRSTPVDRSGYLPSFSLAERDRRWAAVRERMTEAGVDALLVRSTDRAWGMARANLRYLTAVPGQEVGLGLFPRSGAGLEDVRLRPGMVFGTNIDVHDPAWRDDVGLMYGDTLVVTEDGPERLVDTPERLVV